MSLTEEPESGASRLKLVGTVLPASDPNEKLPNVDIIHVVGVDPGRRLGLDTIIEDSVSSRKREYIFQCNITGLLLGDLVWDEIQNEALQLLEGLLASSEIDKASLSGASSFNSHKDAMLSRSFPPQETSVHAVRIFIAYDLGALIVKKVYILFFSCFSSCFGAFDFFTATLGISTEFAVQGKPASQDEDWLDPPQWIALQRMLLPLALPQSRIFEAKAYRDWAASPRSPILYIQGRDESHSRSLADNFCLYEQGRFENRQDYSNDPLRNNMNSMICSALLQFQSAIASEMVDKDLQNIFSLLLADRAGTGALFVLRKHFWGELQSLLEISDFYFKAVVTSRKRLQLLEDAQESGLWLLYKESEDSLAAHLCPGGYGKHRVNRFLQALGGRDKTELTHIISLIQAHTNWPDDPSSAAWSGFGILLDQVKPTTSPAALLDKILRSVPDKLGLCWVLFPSELACYKFLPNPTHVEIRQSLQILRSCISVLAEVNYDKDDPSYLWNEIKPMAHQSMAYFLHHYLTTPATQALQPDGEGFIYYAITAFPYHLEQGSEFLSQMKHDFHSPKSPLLPWARMYWAMSNPFSRHSAANPDTTLLKALERFTEGSDDMNEAALNYARLMIINGTRENTTEGDAIVETTAVKNINSWPSKALWRAVWLNMARIDVSSKWFPSPLYLASALGHSQIVKTLLQAEAKTRVQGKGGLGVLQTATAYGHQDIVRALVAKDPGLLEIEQPDTPLDHASIWGKWTTVEVLVELGAQVDFNPSSDGWTPLMVAAYHGHARTVKVLLTKHANPNHPGPGDIYTPLWYAAMHAQSVESVRALLDHGADPNHEILRPPLVCEICASSNICPERKLAILDTGLMLAANKGDLPVVEWLIAHNANAGPTTKQSHSALYFAVINGHQQIIQQLLAYGSPINTVFEAGNTLLHLSINEGAKQIGMLLEAGADPELESDDGFTCLHIAIFQNKPEVVAQLIDQKVDINHCNGQGWSPIHLACYVTDPNPEIVRLLADAGARLTDTVDSGFSPLHLAASKGVPSIIAALLEFRGALDIEQHDNDGLTPLMQAVGGGANINAQSAEGPDEVARLLLSQTDLDITLSSPNYGTVLHIACQTQNLAAVINLLDRGVDVNQQVPGTPSYTSGSSRKDRLPKGYEVHAMYNTVVSNAIIIQYLISEGLSLKESNCLGRLPIHYAAANGLDNFEAVLRGDSTLLSAADSSGKTALHWAAQFGRIQTVERILAHVSSPEERKKLLNQADIDGWTALSWAIRPNYSVYIGASSELCNQTRTIQFLIEKYEVFTEIICLLQEADSTRRTEKNMSSRSIQPYKTQRYFCDICLQDMWGPVWRCHVCLTFDVCKKCYGRIDLYHGHLTDENGEPHKFMLLYEAAPEVQEDKPSAESRASHAPSDNGTSERTHDADINPSPGSEQDSDRTENVVDQELEDIMNFSVGDYDEEDGVDGEQSP
ncbi:ankyrin repeat-containing domain protein [Aspergillus welwitschiae]|uniref:Ankyrin repeat-containing domain protein n=1 Tax=Aspergillus welwitschiae TaxID=1341132 RepID=A0A3F3QHZ3_9EURO|nr:ankyrin repeat-containing domain protein [Aspergillus welwitschiae]RDH38276.1 ankyrin repeat-containing domain protein [Aspergillus welwitschiae]